jgi:hypothetical protein
MSASPGRFSEKGEKDVDKNLLPMMGQDMDEQAMLDLAKSEVMFDLMLGFEDFLQAVSGNQDAELEQRELNLLEAVPIGSPAHYDITQYVAGACVKACDYAQAGFVLGLYAAHHPLMLLNAAKAGYKKVHGDN